MSTAGWIFMVGFRVFDLGAMIAWLVWFLRLRDEPDDPGDEGWGDDPPAPDGPDRPRGPSDGLPLPDAAPWPVRLRDHAAPPRHAPARRTPAEDPRTPARA